MLRAMVLAPSETNSGILILICRAAPTRSPDIRAPALLPRGGRSLFFYPALTDMPANSNLKIMKALQQWDTYYITGKFLHIHKFLCITLKLTFQIAFFSRLCMDNFQIVFIHLEKFHTIWKVSRQSEKFSDNLESFQKNWKVSKQDEEFPGNLKKMVDILCGQPLKTDCLHKTSPHRKIGRVKSKEGFGIYGCAEFCQVCT